MSRLAIALAALATLFASAGVVRGAGQPVVRVTLDPKGPVLVGQQVKVSVQVLVPNFFTSGLEIPTIDIPGTIVTKPDESSVHLNETIGGQSYAGIQQSFVITPQRAGEFSLPPARITFKYAAVPGQATDGAVTLPPQKLTAKLPAGVAASGTSPGAPAEPVARVTVSQSLDRDLRGIKVGDTLTRTVSAFAERTQAMMIPPPTFEAPEGVRVYRKDPVLTDETKDRVGFLGGRRTDRATYLFEKPGEYTLPAVDIAWFDVKNGKQQLARAAAIKVSVAENPSASPAIAPEPPPEVEAGSQPARRLDWTRVAPWTAGLLLGTLALMWLMRRCAPRLQAWYYKRRREREESEPAYFARAEQACRASDASAAYRDLSAWTRRAGAPSLAAWSAAVGHPVLGDQVAALERVLFAASRSAAPWDGRRLAAVFSDARRIWLDSHRHAVQQSAPGALPALNP